MASSGDASALPPGWEAVESASRPGELVYANIHTGERIGWMPTQPASEIEDESPDLMSESFDITITSLGSLGMAIVSGSNGGFPVVSGFSRLASGRLGPVEQTGRVRRDDRLLAVNGDNVMGAGSPGLPWMAFLDKLRARPLTLLFCPPERRAPTPTRDRSRTIRATECSEKNHSREHDASCYPKSFGGICGRSSNGLVD